MAALGQIDVQIESSRATITELVKEVPSQLMGAISDSLKSKFQILEQLGTLDTVLTEAPETFKADVQAFKAVFESFKTLLEKGMEAPTLLFSPEFRDKLEDLSAAGTSIFKAISKNPEIKKAVADLVADGRLLPLSDGLVSTLSKVVEEIKAPIATVMQAIKQQEQLIADLKSTLKETRAKVEAIAEKVEADGKACLAEIGVIRETVKNPSLASILKAGWGILKLLKKRDEIKANLSAALNLPKTASEFKAQLKVLVTSQQKLVTETFSTLKEQINSLHGTLSSGEVGTALRSEGAVLATAGREVGGEIKTAVLDAVWDVLDQAKSKIQQQVQLVAMVAFQSTKSAITQVMEEAGGPLATGVKAAMHAEKKGEALVSAVKAVKDGTGSSDAAALVLQDILDGEDVETKDAEASKSSVTVKAEAFAASGKAVVTTQFQQLMARLEAMLTDDTPPATGEAKGETKAETDAVDTDAVGTDAIAVSVQAESSTTVNLDAVDATAQSSIVGATPATPAETSKIGRAWQRTKTVFAEIGAMAKAHPVRTVLTFSVIPVIAVLSVASLGTDAGVHGLWHAAHHLVHSGVQSVKGFLERTVIGGVKGKIDQQEKAFKEAFSADNIRAKGEAAIGKIEDQLKSSETTLLRLVHDVPGQLLVVLTRNFDGKLADLETLSGEEHRAIVDNVQTFKAVLSDVKGLLSSGLTPEGIVSQLEKLETAGTALFASLKAEGAALPASVKEGISHLEPLLSAVKAPVHTIVTAIHQQKVLIQSLRDTLQSTRDQIEDLAGRVEEDVKACLSEIETIRTAMKNPTAVNVIQSGLGLLSLLRQRRKIEKDVQDVKALPQTVAAFKGSLVDLVSQQKALLSDTKSQLSTDLSGIRTAVKETDLSGATRVTVDGLRSEGIAVVKDTSAQVAEELGAVIDGALKTVQIEIQGVVTVAFTATKEAATKIMTEATGPLGKIMRVIQRAKQNLQSLVGAMSAYKKGTGSLDDVITQMQMITGDPSVAVSPATTGDVALPVETGEAGKSSRLEDVESKIEAKGQRLADLSHEKFEALLKKLEQLLTGPSSKPVAAPSAVPVAASDDAKAEEVRTASGASVTVPEGAKADSVHAAATLRVSGAKPASAAQVDTVKTSWPRARATLSFLGSKAVAGFVGLGALTVGVVVSVYRAHELKIPLLHDLMHLALDKGVKTAKEKFGAIESGVIPIARETLSTLKGRVLSLVGTLESRVASYPEKLLEAVESGAVEGIKAFLNQTPEPIQFEGVLAASEGLSAADKAEVLSTTAQLETLQSRITAQIKDLKAEIGADGLSGRKIAETLMSPAVIQKMTYLEQLVTSFNQEYSRLEETLSSKGVDVALPTLGTLMKEHPIAAFLQSISTLKSTVAQEIDKNVAEVKAQIQQYQALVQQIEDTEKEIKTLTAQTRQLYEDFTQAGVLGKLKLATTLFLRRNDYKKAVQDVRTVASEIPRQVKATVAVVTSAGKDLVTTFKGVGTDLAQTGKAMVESFKGETDVAARGLATTVSSGIKGSMYASLQSFVGELESDVMTTLHEMETDLTTSAEQVADLVKKELDIPEDVSARLQEMLTQLKDAKAEVMARREEAKTEAMAATRLQAGFKGMQARKEVKTLRDAALAAQADHAAQVEKETKAATRVQAGIRGMNARKEVRRLRDEALAAQTAQTEKEAQARETVALKLQSQFRGMKARDEAVIRRQEAEELKREAELKAAETVRSPLREPMAPSVPPHPLEGIVKKRVSEIEGKSDRTLDINLDASDTSSVSIGSGPRPLDVVAGTKGAKDKQYTREDLQIHIEAFRRELESINDLESLLNQLEGAILPQHRKVWSLGGPKAFHESFKSEIRQSVAYQEGIEAFKEKCRKVIQIMETWVSTDSDKSKISASEIIKKVGRVFDR